MKLDATTKSRILVGPPSFKQEIRNSVRDFVQIPPCSRAASYGFVCRSPGAIPESICVGQGLAGATLYATRELLVIAERIDITRSEGWQGEVLELLFQ